MKYCPKCKVSIRGIQELCPLCQTPLQEKDSANSENLTESANEPCYPELTTVYSRYKIFFKILIFVAVIAGVSSVAINTIFPNTGRWSLLVIVGIIGFLISTYCTIRQLKSIPKNITWQAVFMSIISIIIDFLTGWHGWSLSYALPIIFNSAMLSMAVLAIITKLPANEYMICMFLDIIFGFIPIIFYWLGLLYQNIPSIICIACSIICLTGIVLFQGGEIIHELEKRFHV